MTANFALRKTESIMRISHRVPLLATALFCVLQWTLSSGFSRSASKPSNTVHQTKVHEPLGTALIDYSTATEFIKEHYGIDHYFGEDVRRVQSVYDARKGVLNFVDDIHDNLHTVRIEPARLNGCGFALVSAPSQVQEFENLQDVQRHYVKEVKDIIPNALGVSKDDIEALVLWHPTLRGEELSVGSRSEDRPGLGPIASRAHIDTDVGAYGLEGVCNLVDKNRVDASVENEDDNTAVSIKDDLMKACGDRRRMLLLNLWRPLVPVHSAPLGLLATKYESGSGIFPNVAPSRGSSQWYIFSNMQPDECLIFKQYDRRLDKQSDIWHCALDVHEAVPSQDSAVGKRKRKSFDIKAMVVLKEQVPKELDRLEAAVSPALTWEESGEFCNLQARQLKARDESI